MNVNINECAYASPLYFDVIDCYTNISPNVGYEKLDSFERATFWVERILEINKVIISWM